MHEWIPVIIMAFAGAVLSFYCGFGLGTLLLPAFMLFFPAPVAIAATAIVHMLSNIFKLFLVGRYADWHIIRSFGILSVVGAISGAFCLTWFAGLGVIGSWSLSDHEFEITAIQLVISVVIIVFAFLEILPAFSAIRLPRRILPFGGLISGFFGGLSGHQGALRSAFLMKVGLSKEAFIGTRVVCACLVDLSRISVYSSQITEGWRDVSIDLVIAATLSAFFGSWLGNKWMKKTELRLLNVIVSISLVLFGIAFGLGMI